MTEAADTLSPPVAEQAEPAPRLSRWARFIAFFADMRQAWRDLSDPFDVEL